MATAANTRNTRKPRRGMPPLPTWFRQTRLPPVAAVEQQSKSRTPGSQQRSSRCFKSLVAAALVTVRLFEAHTSSATKIVGVLFTAGRTCTKRSKSYSTFGTKEMELHGVVGGLATRSPVTRPFMATTPEKQPHLHEQAGSATPIAMPTTPSLSTMPLTRRSGKLGIPGFRPSSTVGKTQKSPLTSPWRLARIVTPARVQGF
mmetsp:Transcript_93894/g.205569  ORF Transcript_93894/g.205569 Transcript_93894/m.205569 type:complete len:202 (-) Transcript_93894:1283-1888(-)